MGRTTRMAILCVTALVMTLGITACMHWFNDDSVPTLVISPVTIVGDRGEILLSVKNMPDGGMASLGIAIGGIAYDAAKISNVSVEALLGFTILAEQFDANEGGFVIAHSCAGLHDGAIAKLTFTVHGSPSLADFAFTEADMSMGDDGNRTIAFQLKDDFAYYAK